MELIDYYDLIGANERSVIKFEYYIQNIYYAGENNLHTWWGEFEICLAVEFDTIDINQGRMVYYDVSKVIIHNKKVKDDSLEGARDSIEIELSSVPMNMNYNTEPDYYYNDISRKYPAKENITRHTTYRVNETITGDIVISGSDYGICGGRVLSR